MSRLDEVMGDGALEGISVLINRGRNTQVTGRHRLQAGSTPSPRAGVQGAWIAASGPPCLCKHLLLGLASLWPSVTAA